uniref:AAA+ ATPase domain-containing protein n=1 Tax=Seriola lalandi dorsalis TaxID=1841481 RepID=A0A3B4Y042_SERLL
MRNKLKRGRNCKDTPRQSKDQIQTTEVISLVLSESSCYFDKTSPEGGSASLAAKDKNGSNTSAAAGISQRVQPLQEKKKQTCCAKGIKIAPIFLRQSESKRSSNGKLYQPVEKPQKPVPPQRDDLQRVKSQRRLSVSTVSQLTEKEGIILSPWRGRLSPSSLHSCLEEIKTSNPVFPVHTVFSTLQRKASEKLRDFGSTGETEQESVNSLSKAENSLQNHLKEKRKRGEENSEGVSKRLRCSLTAEDAIGVDQCHLLAQGVQESTVVSDVLWTDKYSPQHSSEVIGNSVSVNKLHSWLKKWKLRADSDERRKMEEKKDEDNNSWDCGDFQGEAGAEGDREDPLCNTVLITGPPGVGKTASVYACAQELGFKVFEVNCSSQRSGRHVLSQLKEATQSHLVETSGKDPLKPAFAFFLTGKTVHPKNVISTTKRRTAQNFGHSSRRGKANPATVTLANYFKMKAKADHLHFGGLSPSEKLDGEKLGRPSAGCDQTVPQSKKTATSLILFEEVDVIFSDDVGFLAAIKTFMTTTKRPVILTANDPLFRERFNCSLEEIIFKTPTVNVCSYLQLVCLAENVQLELDDVSSLLTLTCGDIRRCLLQLQLWVHGGGGRASQSGGLLKEPTRTWILLPKTCNTSMDLQEFSPFPNLDSNDSELAPSDTDPHLHRKKYIARVFDTTSPSTLTHKPQSTSLSLKGARSRLPSSSDKTEQKSAQVATDCLDALTDFFDLMSYLDATLPAAAKLVSGSCSPESFVWTGADIKDGLLDEMSEEGGRSWSQERLSDIQAAAEGLGFHRCWWRVSEVRTEAQKYSQELEDKERRGFCFSPCYTWSSPSSVSQRQYKLSRTVLSSKSFSLLGNRQAVSVDYMPVLRSICRFHTAKQLKEESVR